MERREFLTKCGAGLAGIIAAGKAPATIVKSLVGAQGTDFISSGWKNPYVTNGLIAMWDGEWNAGPGQHDPNATVWKDMVGSSDLAINVSSSVSIENNAMRVTFSSQNQSLRAIIGDFMDGNTAVTVKIAAQTLVMGNNQQLFLGPKIRNNYNDFCVIALNNNRGFLCNNGQMHGKGSSAIGAFSITYIEKVGVFKNTIFLTPYSSNMSTYGNQGKISIGAGAAQNFRIYNIAIYSRALTEAEIQHNYLVDKERFNLP